MYAYDVNGDGLNDIITSLEAHGFGLAWYEQYREGSDIRFREHVFMNKAPEDNPYGVKFSEVHAIDLVDMDGDGVKDIVAGKRFWSHGRTGDPDRNDAAVLYWFKLVRNADHSVDFVPHLIDDQSGVGTQVVAADINGDGLPDTVVGNKRGTFVHLQQKQSVTREEWQAAQPARLFPAIAPDRSQMITTQHVRAATGVVLVAILLLTRGDLAGQTTAGSRDGAAPDREYVLESSMIGYRGRGGEIDGVRNPTLWARTGERVRLTIINSELMVHDIALEKLKIKSPEILDKGASASVTFTASASDTYYCSLPGHRAAGMEGRLEVSDAPPTRSEGVAPEANGRPLNLDFETGTLDDWTATGDAFDIVKGDGLPEGGAERASVVRGQSGAYWVSSGVRGSARRGTLISAPIRVTHPYASFLVSGGGFASTRVEVALAQDQQIIYTISGADSARLRPAVVDLRPHAGKDIVIRLVDDETGAATATYLKENPWAHVNFDQFRFHDAKPFFPNEITPAEISVLPPMDRVLHAGLSGIEAARAMTVPKGFTVKLAAAEPEVVRPIAFALDDRGRLWVAEAHTYPVRAGRRRARPHPDLRRYQRRRSPRQPQGLHREPEPGERPGGRLRRRVRRRGALSPVHSRQGGDRHAGGTAADSARRVGIPGYPRDAQYVHVGT